jgi:hypothetical protein
MFLFGHVGVTLGIFYGFSIFLPKIKTIIDPKYLILGSILPDLIDKPIGRVFFASTFSNGRIIGHTLLFSVLLFLIGLYLYDLKRDIFVLSLATGSFFHIISDQIWNFPKTLFWPIYGLSFPKSSADNMGLRSIIAEITSNLKNIFTLHISHSSIPEFLGLIILVVLVIYWCLTRKKSN